MSVTVKAVKDTIHRYLCNIPDYQGNTVAFIEQIVEQLGNCIDPSQAAKPVRYIRKRRELKQTWEGKTVNGIILDVTRRVLRTPSVIVDAMLGQGPSLDCYNQQLQDAAVVSAQVANQKTQQAMAVINAIADPLDKARFYNNVFGTCCSTPQTVAGGCACGTPASAEVPAATD